jgi:nicotinamide mononucleotide (NMN) deamidase PncC
MNHFADQAEQLVRKIHDAAGRVVVVLNGGSRAVAELLEVPGGSKTLLEAVVPYSEAALTAWLGSRPEQSCSSRTARAMAVVAFGRAIRYGAEERQAAGVACSAALATDRPKRGPHRTHVAVQTAEKTRHEWLELKKDARSRREEEEIVSRMVLNAVAEACDVDARLELPLLDEERVETEQAVAPQAWQDVFLGRVEAKPVKASGDLLGAAPHSNAAARAAPRQSESGNEFPHSEGRAVLCGAFDPLHAGHRRMAEIATQILNLPTAFELSILNVDKPALDYLEIERRLAQFPPQQPVWLTRAATFDDKSRLFSGATFVVGVDTLRRIADPRYYGNDPAAMLLALQRIIERGCRFLVFGRKLEASFDRLANLDLPGEFRNACREVPPEQFREDVSSTELRPSRI